VRHSIKNAAKPRSSLLVHADGHEVTGLKTYRGPKRKEQLGVCSLPGFYVPGVVGREFCLGAPDCSVVINDTLAIERRGGRGGEGTPRLVRSVGRDQRPWNKGLLIGQKKPLEPKHVWSIRVRLEISRSWRDLAIFNLAIDSKLRACDLVKLQLNDICSGAKVRHRATIVQKKTGRPVQFEITEQSRSSVEAWLPTLRTIPSRLHASPHISIRQYARLVHRWVESIGLAASYGTHSMRRTKAAQIYRKTGNLRAVQLLLGHTKLESTVRYLGIEVDDALNMAEQIEL
jgi:integrase